VRALFNARYHGFTSQAQDALVINTTTGPVQGFIAPKAPVRAPQARKPASSAQLPPSPRTRALLTQRGLQLVRQFLGVPFAQPPVGALRLKPPQARAGASSPAIRPPSLTAQRAARHAVERCFQGIALWVFVPAGAAAPQPGGCLVSAR
jgi:hypothetical protein